MDQYEEKYKHLYNKYKIKYLQLKEQSGGVIITCPYCNIKINNTNALEHIRIVHDTILTREQLSQINQELKRKRYNEKRKEGRYVVKCRICNIKISRNSELARHMVNSHADELIENDFYFVDYYLKNKDLVRIDILRRAFVDLEIKFGKIPEYILNNAHSLSSYESITLRRQARRVNYKRIHNNQIRLINPYVVMPIIPVMPELQVEPEMNIDTDPAEIAAILMALREQ